MPVPLLVTEGPGGAEYRTYDQFHVTDRDAGTWAVPTGNVREKPYRRQGFLRPGGYSPRSIPTWATTAFLSDS